MAQKKTSAPSSDRSTARTAKKMREFAKVYNSPKMCPLIHDLIRVLFPGTKVKDKSRLLQRHVDKYNKFRDANPFVNLPELMLRNLGKDGRIVGLPPGVQQQMREWSIDKKLLRSCKGVIVTSAQFGGSLNRGALQALKNYAEYRKFPLVALPIKYGPVMTVYQRELDQRVLTSTFDEDLKGHILFENVALVGGMINLNVMRMRPTLGKFLTDKVCQRGGNVSQIFAAPKLELEHRPRMRHDYPKAIMTTGAVTHPNYNVDNLGQQDRTGEIAAEEHTYAAIIIEFTGKKTFHYRQLMMNTAGEFYDIDPIRGGALFVSPKGIEHRPDAINALYLGDWHTGKTDPVVRKVTFERMGPELQPDHVFLGDFFDGDSISHHDQKYVSRRAYKGRTGYDSLQQELDQLVVELEWMQSWLPSAYIHVLASNHNDVLSRYIEEKRWIDDPPNLTLGAKLFSDMQQELLRRKPSKHELSPIDPINWWIKQHLPDIVTHGRRSKLLLPEDPKAKKILMTQHGDVGPSGQRSAGMRSFSKLNQWVIIGHAHSAAIQDSVWRVGTSTYLTEHYVSSPATNWTHTHAVVFENGQRQLLNIINGSYHGWRAQKRAPKKTVRKRASVGRKSKAA